jgi:hypothetical protein
MQNLAIIKLFVIFLMAWIAIELWGKTYTNLAYHTFHFNPDSFRDSFLVASIWTLVMFYLVLHFPELYRYGELVTAGTSGTSNDRNR